MADLSNRKTARKPSLSTAAPTSSATLFLSKAQPEDDFGLIRKRLGTQLYPVMHPWPFSLEVGFATLRGRPLRGPASLFCAFIPTSSFFFFSFACFLRRRVPCGLSLSPRQSHEPSAASGATRLAEPVFIPHQIPRRPHIFDRNLASESTRREKEELGRLCALMIQGRYLAAFLRGACFDDVRRDAVTESSRPAVYKSVASPAKP